MSSGDGKQKIAAFIYLLVIVGLFGFAIMVAVAGKSLIYGVFVLIVGFIILGYLTGG